MHLEPSGLVINECLLLGQFPFPQYCYGDRTTGFTTLTAPAKTTIWRVAIKGKKISSRMMNGALPSKLL